MDDEHIFVQDMLKKHNISVSQLARVVGMADSTLYEYTGGRKKTIPISIWRALFELTQDVRILELVIGSVETFVVPMPKPDSQDYAGDTLKKLLEKRKKDIECEIAILDILADGKIDQADHIQIEQYRDAHPEAVTLDAQIFSTIMTKYEEAVSKAKNKKEA